MRLSYFVHRFKDRAAGRKAYLPVVYAPEIQKRQLRRIFTRRQDAEDYAVRTITKFERIFGWKPPRVTGIIYKGVGQPGGK